MGAGGMEAELEEQRKSLLDVVLERLKESGKQAILGRVVYIAEVPQRLGDGEGVAGFHAEQVERLGDGKGAVTGLLIAFPDVVLGLAEGPPRKLLGLLKAIQAAGAGESRMARVKVVSHTEDITGRVYQGFQSIYINEPVSDKVEAEDDPDALVSSVSDLNIALLKLGHTISDMPEEKQYGYLNRLRAHFTDLPPCELLLQVARADECPTIAEFLHIVDSTVEIDLESEKVWPMASPLRF